ncbi:hypothetical protein ACL02U_29475 [Streptomyces sp. MS06]|uniref:hypothetical protein n=1 Tax=Streptomyces sp. MS06 TaxID=3385974 RepID=UPI00399EF619
MFLVHITLDPPPGASRLPDDIVCLLRCCDTGEDGVEYIAVHASAKPWPTIGVFLTCPDLATAEAEAELLWWRAMARHPVLAAWRLRRVEVPLLHPEALWRDERRD